LKNTRLIANFTLTAVEILYARMKRRFRLPQEQMIKLCVGISSTRARVG